MNISKKTHPCGVAAWRFLLFLPVTWKENLTADQV